MLSIIIVFFVSLVVSFVIFPLLIPRLKRAGIVGRDINKKDAPEIAEMGGLVIVGGFTAGILAFIGIEIFFQDSNYQNGVPFIELFAALSTILIMALIGIFDDLVLLRQDVKAITPLFAALPLVAIKAGYTMMSIPFLGSIDFGVLYYLLLIPIGVTGAANAINMLAGFNGVEIGMGIVAMCSLLVIAGISGAGVSEVILIAAIGALLAALYYNWYPAKVFIGDTGTLSIGAIIATSVILGNFETAGVILIVPYIADFIIKAKNGFPSKNWWGIIRKGKLYCPSTGPVGLCQLIMKVSGGISERNLAIVLITIEAVFGIIAILLYL